MSGDRIADKLDFGRLLLATVSVAAMALAQAPQPEFEVASVKPVGHPVGPHGVSLIINHGRLNIDAAALRQVIGLAYGIQRVRVQGGPGWLDSELYDFVAKAESADASRDQIRAMLRTLLADRFKLAVHHDTKEVPVYTLVVGKNGAKFPEAKDTEKTGVTSGMTAGKIQLTLQKQSMAGLVNTLANILRNPVLDKTGLTGQYNFKLEWTPEGSQSQRPGNNVQPQPVDSGPDIFAAVQEQLGLKLDVKKGPVEVLVVDHAEKASEN